MLLFKLTQCFIQQLFFQHTPKLSKDLNYSTQKMEKKIPLLHLMLTNCREITLKNVVKIFCSILQTKFPTKTTIIQRLYSDQLFHILLGICHRDNQAERTALQQSLLQHSGCTLWHKGFHRVFSHYGSSHAAFVKLSTDVKNTLRNYTFEAGLKGGRLCISNLMKSATFLWKGRVSHSFSNGSFWFFCKSYQPVAFVKSYDSVRSHWHQKYQSPQLINYPWQFIDTFV